MKPTNPSEVEKFVLNTLKEIQELMPEIPKESELKIIVRESENYFKVEFGFKEIIFGRSKKPLAVVNNLDNYWFTWLKKERGEKLISYCYDAYNYIMHVYYPTDPLFSKIEKR